MKNFATTLAGAYAVVTSGAPMFTPVTISNVCGYPRVVCSPLASSFTTTDAPINLTLTELSTDISFTGNTQFTINSTVATVFNPAISPVISGNNDVVGTYDIQAGTGMGGTLTAPAIPIDGSAVGVCPVSVSKSVQVSGVVDQVEPIPTMSEWGLMIFGLLMLNLGVFFIKRVEILPVKLK